MSQQQEFEFTVTKTEGGYIVGTSSSNGSYSRAIVIRENGVKAALKNWLEGVNSLTAESLNEG